MFCIHCDCAAVGVVRSGKEITAIYFGYVHCVMDIGVCVLCVWKRWVSLDQGPVHSGDQTSQSRGWPHPVSILASSCIHLSQSINQSKVPEYLLWLGTKASIHLCRAAGNTVWNMHTSPMGHFAYWTVCLLFGHFAYWTLRRLLPGQFTYRLLFILPSRLPE